MYCPLDMFSTRHLFHVLPKMSQVIHCLAEEIASGFPRLYRPPTAAGETRLVVSVHADGKTGVVCAKLIPANESALAMLVSRHSQGLSIKVADC